MAEQAQNPTDGELITGLKNEQSWAYKQLYRSYYPMVASYVTQNNGHDEDARDIFQELLIALIKIIRKPDFKLNTSTKFSTFTFSVAKKLWLMKLRGKKGYTINSTDHLENTMAFDETELEEKKVIEEKHVILARVFRKIGEDCQKILDAFYFKKMSMQEIADMMGYTYEYVRVKKNRCMNDYKQKIMDDPNFQALQ